MKRGTKTKPTAIALYEGNPGHKTKAELTDSIQPVAITDIKAPLHLDDVGAAEWNRLAPILAGYNILSELDRNALEAYCAAWSEYRDCIEILRDGGRTVMNGKGQIVARPEVAMKRNSLKEIIRIGAEFGMTPSSRAGLAINLGTVQKTVAERLRDMDDEDDF